MVPLLDFTWKRYTILFGHDVILRKHSSIKGGETGSTEVRKYTLHAEVLVARKTAGNKTNADDYAYAVAA